MILTSMLRGLLNFTSFDVSGLALFDEQVPYVQGYYLVSSLARVSPQSFLTKKKAKFVVSSFHQSDGMKRSCYELM